MATDETPRRCSHTSPERSPMRLAVLTALLLALLAPTAAAQDPSTGGVPQADADAACAAVVGQDPPADERVAEFRAQYETTDPADDDGAGLSPEWQHLVVQQEMHRDYTGAAFTCDDAVAVFAQPEPSAPEPGDECTDPISGQPGTVNENGNCVQDRSPYSSCEEALADRLDLDTIIIVGPDGASITCTREAPPTTTEPTEPPSTPGPAPGDECELNGQAGTLAGDLVCTVTVPPTEMTAPTSAPPLVDGEFTSGGGNDGLAYTGVSIGWAVALGVGLLAAGGGALLYTRRWALHG